MIENLDDTMDMKNDQKTELMKKYAYYFNQLAQRTIADLKTGINEESSIYRKYPKERVLKMLKCPQRSEKQIRELSGYLWLISSHYRRLIEYYASLLLYNYYLSPIQLPFEKKDIDVYKKKYYKAVNFCDKWNFQQEAKKAITIAVRDGVFCGLYYEESNSFYIRPFDTKYTRITSIKDGCFIFSIDLLYFSRNEKLLYRYDEDIINAYRLYKRNKKGNRFYEPKNGICIKADPTDEVHSLPIFVGLIASIYDIEEYSVIQKIKSKNDIYKAVVMKMETDEYGIPKLSQDAADIYYEQASNNIADDVGLIMSPFEVDSISFSTNATSDTNAVTDAENEFWYKAGVSPLIFGSQKATSQGSLILSVKPDEALAFSLLKQFERFFNMRLKEENLPFKISFLMQSIFNVDEVTNRYQKAATYGVGGAKLKYAASIGLSPAEVVGMSYLEDDILEIGTKSFIHPLISSNTLSNGGLDDSNNKQTNLSDNNVSKVENNNGETGRPTNKSKGIVLSDEGEKTAERK